MCRYSRNRFFTTSACMKTTGSSLKSEIDHFDQLLMSFDHFCYDLIQTPKPTGYRSNSTHKNLFEPRYDIFMFKVDGFMKGCFVKDLLSKVSFFCHFFHEVIEIGIYVFSCFWIFYFPTLQKSINFILCVS